MPADRATRNATIVHLVGMVTWLVGPLVAYLLTDDEFVRENARNAFNWQVFVAIYTIVSMALVVVLVGFLLLPIVALLHVVFCVVAAVKAHEGTAWRYPLSRPIL